MKVSRYPKKLAGISGCSSSRLLLTKEFCPSVRLVVMSSKLRDSVSSNNAQHSAAVNI